MYSKGKLSNKRIMVLTISWR